MKDLSSSEYDICRATIDKLHDKKNLSWEEISLAGYKTDEDLIRFLGDATCYYGWPGVSESDWKYMVNEHKELLEHKTTMEVQLASACVVDSSVADNNITLPPKNPSSAWFLYEEKLKQKGFSETSRTIIGNDNWVSYSGGKGVPVSDNRLL